MINRQDLRKVGDYLYEIPQTCRPDMRVPAHLYADEQILEKALEDRSLDQLADTATLPGVVAPVMAMPDIHQGYGFPIGGVAATRLPDGVISPGGVGYDINCLSGDSLVLHALGYTRPIAEMATAWETATLQCRDLVGQHPANTAIVHYLAFPPRSPVLRLMTDAGDTITATADHPFWTPSGMTPLGDLRPGDRVAVAPFAGVPYKAPDDRVIVDETAIVRSLAEHQQGAAGNALGQILKHLRLRGLLPLRADSTALPYLLRLVGFVFGDGHIRFEGGSGGGVTWFYGEPEDLETIRLDVQAVGFTPSRVYTRVRQHHIVTTYDEYEFSRSEAAFKVQGSTFAILLTALGVPVGNKAAQDFALPTWLETCPLWQQRLFLAAFFGAELTSPKAFDKAGHNFYTPALGLNKHEGFLDSGRDFLAGIAEMLERFGVECGKISTRREQTNPNGIVSHRARLLLSSTPESLISLWSKVGFEYNRRKQRLAGIATQYLKRKTQVWQARDDATQKAVAMRDAGATQAEILMALVGPHTGRGFILHTLYRDPARSMRAGAEFGSFVDYQASATDGVGQSDMVWERVNCIEMVSDVTTVYDFTVAHPDHNFVANGFVVSNCGVRALTANLDADEIRPHLRRLAEALYRRLPSGVGVKGSLHINKSELDHILARGSQWALKEGYARPDDIEHTEERGRMAGADPDKISKSAKERGLDQVGTLGSGNHFAEIDVVSQIFDPAAADAFGLRAGQVVVQIHCGSRGLGHQVATDYIQTFQGASRRYGFELPDRQLVCAPFNSPEGQAYLGAMNAAANYAWANRQVLTYRAREAFEEVLAGHVADWDLSLLYDVAHNMAKVETHIVEGRETSVCVHRKGATRAFGPGHAAAPADYRAVGQPVLVPGSMGTASYILVGTAASMARTFGSCCHGAGRLMSRSEAKRQVRGETLRHDLEQAGVLVQAGSMSGLAEEAPQAYKDVDRVVAVVQAAGIARIVARLEPLAVIKG
jgi:tRNA-splicing ligase RtcB (3'-phosphate/5'-hydroxy nucleic acid ligase)